MDRQGVESMRGEGGDGVGAFIFLNSDLWLDANGRNKKMDVATSTYTSWADLGFSRRGVISKNFQN